MWCVVVWSGLDPTWACMQWAWLVFWKCNVWFQREQNAVLLLSSTHNKLLDTRALHPTVYIFLPPSYSIKTPHSFTLSDGFWMNFFSSLFLFLPPSPSFYSLQSGGGGINFHKTEHSNASLSPYTVFYTSLSLSPHKHTHTHIFRCVLVFFSFLANIRHVIRNGEGRESLRRKKGEGSTTSMVKG